VVAVDADDITFTPAGDIVATNVQAAIEELDSEKLAKASNLSDVADAATAFGNIKQDATISATGVSERATDAEAIAGTDTSRHITPANLSARLLAISGDTDEPTGFVNTTDSTVAWSDSGPNYTFTIDEAVPDAGWTVYVQGNRYLKSAAETKQIAPTEGLHFIYYDSAGDLQETTTITDAIITSNALVAAVYWDSSNSLGELFDDRHGVQMDGATHLYLHETIGAAYESGLGLGNFSADGSGADNAHAQFSTGAGEIHDEDLEFMTNAINQATGLEIWYLDTTNWRKATNSGYSIRLDGGTGRMAYNNAGAQTVVTDNRYALTHVFAWNSLNGARDGAASEIGVLNTSGLPGPEMKAIGSVIFQTKDTYGNDVKSRVRTTDAGDNYVDFRTNPIGQGSPATDHGGLGGLGDNDHPQYVQTAGDVINALGDLGGGTDDIDVTVGNTVTATVSTGTQTFTFSNPSATLASSFTIILTNGGSQTINWPVSVDWDSGVEPVLTASGIDVLSFLTVDGGTTWYGFTAGLDMQ